MFGAGKQTESTFFGGLCGAFCCTCCYSWPPVWPVSPLTSQQIGVTIALLTTIIGVISVNQTWAHEWDILPISLQVSGGGGVLCLITQCVQDTDWWQAIIFYNPRLSAQLVCNKQNNGVVKVRGCPSANFTLKEPTWSNSVTLVFGFFKSQQL